MERYPQDITQEEHQIGFKLTEIENPLKHLSNDPWTHSTQEKITAVAIIISEEKRILKVAQDEASLPVFSYQEKDGEKWHPKMKFQVLEKVRDFLNKTTIE